MGSRRRPGERSAPKAIVRPVIPFGTALLPTPTAEAPNEPDCIFDALTGLTLGDSRPPTVQIMPITPAQCRAARALLSWSQVELVEYSKTTRKIVANFERGATLPHPRNMTLITAAFEAQGIKFLKRNGEGVLLRRKPPGR